MAKKTNTTRAALAKRATVKRLPPVKAKRTPKIDAAALIAVPASDETVPVQMVPERLLGDGVVVGDFGLVSMRLTPEEEAKLNEPLDINDVRIKPDGAVYVPHFVYTRRLNQAFGRTAWQMVPAARPQIVNGIVSMPYRLHVHGKPIAFAWGEQEYHESNKNQTYGDAIEATMASGIRRCCKHLGIGSELWDSSFGEMFKGEYAVEVSVLANSFQNGQWAKKEKTQWRRRADPPFHNELNNMHRRPSQTREPYHEDAEPRQEWSPPPSERVAPKPAPPVASHSHDEREISDAQRQRLWTIARRRGRQDDEVKRYLASVGYARSEAIRRKDYDQICTAIEHPGHLPGQARMPGEEG